MVRWVLSAARRAAFAVLFCVLSVSLAAGSSAPSGFVGAGIVVPAQSGSTLTLTSSTTAYSAGQLIASSATATSIAVPSFSVGASAYMPLRLRLYSNDTTSTAWAGQTVQIDTWSAAPTFATGDRTAFAGSIATGSANHLVSYTCVFQALQGDGLWAECTPIYGTPAIRLASGPTVYWTAEAVSGSGVTGASKTFTVVPEALN